MIHLPYDTLLPNRNATISNSSGADKIITFEDGTSIVKTPTGSKITIDEPQGDEKAKYNGVYTFNGSNELTKIELHLKVQAGSPPTTKINPDKVTESDNIYNYTYDVDNSKLTIQYENLGENSEVTIKEELVVEDPVTPHLLEYSFNYYERDYKLLEELKADITKNIKNVDFDLQNFNPSTNPELYKLRGHLIVKELENQKKVDGNNPIDESFVNATIVNVTKLPDIYGNVFDKQRTNLEDNETKKKATLKILENFQKLGKNIMNYYTALKKKSYNNIARFERSGYDDNDHNMNPNYRLSTKLINNNIDLKGQNFEIDLTTSDKSNKIGVLHVVNFEEKKPYIKISDYYLEITDTADVKKIVKDLKAGDSIKADANTFELISDPLLAYKKNKDILGEIKKIKKYNYFIKLYKRYIDEIDELSINILNLTAKSILTKDIGKLFSNKNSSALEFKDILDLNKSKSNTTFDLNEIPKTYEYSPDFLLGKCFLRVPVGLNSFLIMNIDELKATGGKLEKIKNFEDSEKKEGSLSTLTALQNLGNFVQFSPRPRYLPEIALQNTPMLYDESNQITGNEIKGLYTLPQRQNVLAGGVRKTRRNRNMKNKKTKLNKRGRSKRKSKLRNRKRKVSNQKRNKYRIKK